MNAGEAAEIDLDSATIARKVKAAWGKRRRRRRRTGYDSSGVDRGGKIATEWSALRPEGSI